jgi:cytosine/adenosine deaminase-related metal-dependent hydrolase
MIVTADWVLPVTGRPLRDGAVLTRGSRIDMVGRLDDMVGYAPKDPVERFPGCVVMPGLVNAHTHLSLTVLAGLIGPMPIRPFQQTVTRAVLAMSDDDFATSAALGALQSLRCGVTSVGDIVYGPEALAACADLGVGGVFFWEAFGIDAEELSGELAEREFPAEIGACSSGRARCGISPHTPYSSGPALLKAEWNVAQRHDIPFAIHVAESSQEQDLMLRGAGPLVETAAALARGFRAPGIGSLAYLESLGVLQDAVAVHCTNLQPGDTKRLKRQARGVVLCPRSNAFLSNGDPPVAELSRAGIHLAVGTDSSVSNGDLDLWEDARALRAMDPTLTAPRIIAMLTHDAALVLGLDHVCGALDRGLQADLAVVRTGETEEPESAVVAHGGVGSIEAVMSAGLWRVREGKPALHEIAVERAAANARGKAERALANE